MKIEVSSCTKCVCYNFGYCTLSFMVTAEGLYVKNEWRDNIVHESCPLRREDLVLSIKPVD